MRIILNIIPLSHAINMTIISSCLESPVINDRCEDRQFAGFLAAYDIVIARQNCYPMFAVIKTSRVVIHGDSLILAGIEASISQDSDCEVIAHTLTCQTPLLVTLEPDVVIFDLASTKPECLPVELQTQPGLLLIGIDPENHEVLLSGQAAGAITLDQITQILHTSGQQDPDQLVMPLEIEEGSISTSDEDENHKKIKDGRRT